MHDSGWQVAHVIANHEKRVAQHFASRSVEYYLPLYSERSRRTDRAVLLERPLFTGYVFVRCETADRLPVISTPGVLRLLGENNPQTISEREISAIREGLAAGHLIRPHPAISVGTPVRVCRGVFVGVTGVVTELRRRCRVVIRLAVIDQCFSLELAWEDLEVVDEVRRPLTAARFPSVVSAARSSLGLCRPTGSV